MEFASFFFHAFKEHYQDRALKRRSAAGTAATVQSSSPCAVELR